MTLLNSGEGTHIHIVSKTSSIELSFDSRLFLGEGLFETMCFDQQGVWAIQRHWQRISSAASALNIPFSVSLTEWRKAIHQTVMGTTYSSGGIKAILVNGAAPRGLDNVAKGSELFIQAFKLPASSAPIHLISAPWVRDANNPVYQYKSINYLEAIQARRYAQKNGADDVLFRDLQGYAMETSTANLFMILNGALYTPEKSGAFLAGIARTLLLECADKINVSVVEKKITLEDCLQSEMLFISNILQFIRPVASLDGKQMATNHPLARKLQTAIDKFSPFIQ